MGRRESRGAAGGQRGGHTPGNTAKTEDKTGGGQSDDDRWEQTCPARTRLTGLT